MIELRSERIIDSDKIKELGRGVKYYRQRRECMQRFCGGRVHVVLQ